MPPPPIDHDLPCAICDYNLKGLSPDANCPECGQPVARTFTAELVHSDPDWLRFQARTMLLLVALCLANYHPFGGSLAGRFSSLLWTFLSIAATLVAVWGCWRLATPEPAGLPGHGHATLQRALRLAAVVVALFHVGIQLRSALHPILWGSAAIAAAVCLIVTNALVAVFLLAFARRSRDPSLIVHARIVLWAFPLIQSSSLLTQLAIGFLATDDMRSSDWIFTVIGTFNYALGLAAYAAVLLMGRLHEVLRAAATAAESRAPSHPPTAPVELAPPSPPATL